MQQSALRRQPGPLASDLRPGRPAVPALRRGRAHPLARPGRRQPPDILVPGVPAREAASATRAPTTSRPATRRRRFDAALAAGVDMIEFDVLPETATRREPRAGARARLRARSRGAPTLEEGLDHLASTPFAGVELDVDLKLPGYEERVVDALRAHGLVERDARLLAVHAQPRRRCARSSPALRLGWSVPRVQARLHAPRRCCACPPTRALPRARRRLPGVAAGAHRAPAAATR